jgi:hypothetical protein
MGFGPRVKMNGDDSKQVPCLDSPVFFFYLNVFGAPDNFIYFLIIAPDNVGKDVHITKCKDGSWAHGCLRRL